MTLESFMLRLALTVTIVILTTGIIGVNTESRVLQKICAFFIGVEIGLMILGIWIF